LYKNVMWKFHINLSRSGIIQFKNVSNTVMNFRFHRSWEFIIPVR
jgi:hypothetical protein